MAAVIVLPAKIQEAKDSSSTCFIELYIVHLRTGDIFLSASDVDIEFAGHTFKAVPFKRETLSRSLDTVIDSCKITLGDGNYDKLAYICNGFDFRGCVVDIFKIMYPDSLEDSNLIQHIYSGEIDSPAYSGGTFSCSIMAKFPKITLPRRNSGLYCNSQFGDEICKMDLKETNLIAQSGSKGTNVIVNGTYDKDFWKDGVIFIEGEARTVLTSNSNSVVPIYGFIQKDLVGKKVKLIRGCNKTPKDCKERYNNMKNYSGFPAVPRIGEYR